MKGYSLLHGTTTSLPKEISSRVCRVDTLHVRGVEMLMNRGPLLILHPVHLELAPTHR